MMHRGHLQNKKRVSPRVVIETKDGSEGLAIRRVWELHLYKLVFVIVAHLAYFIVVF